MGPYFVIHIDPDSHLHQHKVSVLYSTCTNTKYLYHTPITGQISDTVLHQIAFYLSATGPNNSKKSEAVGFRLNKCASDEPPSPSPGFRRQHHMQFVCHNTSSPFLSSSSFMDSKLRLLNGMFTAKTSTAIQILQYAWHTNLFHQDQNYLLCWFSGRTPSFQLRHPFPYLQGRIAETVQSLLSSLALIAQTVG